MEHAMENRGNLRDGQYLRLVRTRVLLYLRLLFLSEETVFALTEKIMGDVRVQARTLPPGAWPAQALSVTLSVLAANGITPDEGYHAIFSEAYHPLPQRQRMGFHKSGAPAARNPHARSYGMVLLLRRIWFFMLVLASTAAGTRVLATILSPNGLNLLKWGILVIFTFLFGWIALNFWTIMAGFAAALLGRDHWLEIPPEPCPVGSDARTALIMPVHNEEVPRIFAALRAMYETVNDAGALAHFDMYILSDSTSQAHCVAEEIYWARLCRDVGGFGKIFYRRRRRRVHKKSGNISDFCRRWGHGYKYMVTLDADSLMDGAVLIRMVNVMEARPDIGILQTAPMAMNQRSLIGRLQQFASHVYGPLFFAGLRFWQLDESGFWGHNAIIRMDPFVRHCALPELPGAPPFGGEILSHDFVEAAFMRRAGWGVWLVHELQHSYEELPPNLLKELARDKRWCQGNIQHLRLVFARGIALGHRILFLQGNLFYFSALMWLCLLVLMTANAVVNFFEIPVYFQPGRSLFPLWTVEYHGLSRLLLGVTLMLLFVPKVMSFFLIALDRGKRAGFGGVWRLGGSIFLETLLSTILAPLRMMFHSWYVIRNLTGRKAVWGSQTRLARRTSLREAFAAHWPATVIALVWAIMAFAVSPTLFWWIFVIVMPLIFGIPISMVYSYPSVGMFFQRMGIFLVPAETDPAPVVRRYQQLVREG